MKSLTLIFFCLVFVSVTPASAVETTKNPAKETKKEAKNEAKKKPEKQLPPTTNTKKYSDTELIEMTKQGTLLSCDRYHYSICPDSCEKVCTSSSCSPGMPCTADCDGPGSCVSKK